jgi:two-component sensor histidine kinase
MSRQSTRHWDEQHWRLAIDAAGVALWAWNVDTDQLAMDERGCVLWGIPDALDVPFSTLSAHIHPADRDRVRAAFAATRSVVGPYEIDFRVMIGDEIRWISARGQGNDDGMVRRVMFGIFLDVTGRKQAEEGHELLAGEMSHRVKNLLAIASGLTVMSSRSAASTSDMAQELTQRLSALGRAHDLIRPLPGHQGQAALLGDLLTLLLAPYDDQGAFSGRVRVAVPRMGIGESAATSLALVVHELATNAVKYGALSVPTGMIDVSCSTSDTETILTWTETGGPSVSAPPEAFGFGSALLKRSVSSKFQGAINHDWAKEGLVVTLVLRSDTLSS